MLAAAAPGTAGSVPWLGAAVTFCKLGRCLRRCSAELKMLLEAAGGGSSTLGGSAAMVEVALQFLLAELNTFYLKFVLWMPPEHYLVLLRLVFFVNVGGVAMREIYDFMDDPKFHKKLGQQAWMVAAITVTEFLIVVKYDTYTITLPLPFLVTQCWILGIILVFTWTLWRFFIRDITLRYKDKGRHKQESTHIKDTSLSNGDTHSDIPNFNTGNNTRKRNL